MSSVGYARVSSVGQSLDVQLDYQMSIAKSGRDNYLGNKM